MVSAITKSLIEGLQEEITPEVDKLIITLDDLLPAYYLKKEILLVALIQGYRNPIQVLCHYERAALLRQNLIEAHDLTHEEKEEYQDAITKARDTITFLELHMIYNNIPF
ncbi:MAG: hypothetical protein NT139_01730 [Candidatus Woesearchaeota archaeon]|nr:hypothetical protein [Candidatus Woesearchaeota archaeon]